MLITNLDIEFNKADCRNKKCIFPQSKGLETWNVEIPNVFASSCTYEGYKYSGTLFKVKSYQLNTSMPDSGFEPDCSWLVAGALMVR